MLILLTIRFVLVPMRVQVPPSTAAYESGMSSFDGESFILLARFNTTGKKTTTTGVLFTNAESVPTTSTSARTTTAYDQPDTFSIR